MNKKVSWHAIISIKRSSTQSVMIIYEMIAKTIAGQVKRLYNIVRYFSIY